MRFSSKIRLWVTTMLIPVLLITSSCLNSGSKEALRQEALSKEELSHQALSAAPSPITPEQAVATMGIGINLGNTLDAYPNEGDWAPPAQAAYLEAFAQAGFKHVRVPVTWGSHVANAPPYRIEPAFLDRVDQVLDWALAQDVYVIVNAHHEIWLKQNYADPAMRQRFAAIWQQLAQRFQHKPARLLFEVLNEPEGMTAAQVNELNAVILPIIRDHNPTRLVIMAGSGFTPVATLADLELPQDSYLIANFHAYDPWAFAGQCTRGWGTKADVRALTAIYDQAAAWSTRRGVPVMVNEFGAAHYDFTAPANVCDPAARLDYLQTHVKLAAARGIAASVWDDNGSFGIYNRARASWGPEKDVLVAPNLRPDR